MFGGWIRTFTADSDVHWLTKGVFALVGLLGIGGAILRARANRLDGWYVLILLAIVFTWLFSEDSNRRLLYGLVPILLIQAALFMRYVLRRMGSTQRRLLTGAIVALPTLLGFPAFLLVQERSWDREAIYPGLRYRFRDMADYYTTLDLSAARAVAAKHAAVLAGLESVREVTPPGARVMWLRPDYVAVLGHREGVPLFRAAQRGEFLRKVRDSRTGYVVVSSLFKAGMDGDESSPEQRFNWLLQSSRVVHTVGSRASDGYEIAILAVGDT
jgi:hypothetical protein